MTNQIALLQPIRKIPAWKSEGVAKAVAETPRGDTIHQVSLIKICDAERPQTFKQYLTSMDLDTEIVSVYSAKHWQDLNALEKDALLDSFEEWVWQYAPSPEIAARNHVAKFDLHQALINAGIPDLGCL